MKHLWILGLLMSFGAQADGLFRLSNVVCGAVTGTPTSGDCGNLVNSIETDVNSNLPDVTNLAEFGEGMSNSSVVATKGNQSSDYSNEIDIVQVGIGTGISADIGDGSLSQLGDDLTTLGGFSISPSVSVGLNPNFIPVDKIGPIEMDRLRLFGNFFAFNVNQDGTDVSFDAKLSSIGFRARYHLMDGKGASSLMKWGGVHLTTGYQYYKMKLEATSNINEPFNSGGATGTAAGTGTITGEVTSHSIPIEVSTYAQLGYVFTIYGGLATDISFGDSDFRLDVDTTITETTATGFSANGNLNIGDGAGPSSLLFRTFIGLQFNVPIFKLYVQAQKTLGQDIIGANVGFKLNW